MTEPVDEFYNTERKVVLPLVISKQKCYSPIKIIRRVH